MLLLALDLGFVVVDTSSAAGANGLVAMAGYPEEKSNRGALTRFGDGVCDREGRFLAGTSVRKMEHRDKKKGSLYRLDGDLTITAVQLGGFSVFDGACFSPDGRTMYFTDGGPAMLQAAYSAEGEIEDIRPFFDFGASALPCSTSSGATVDRAGNVWVVLPEAHAVVCISSSGGLLRHVHVPCNRPSALAFGGPGLDVLFLTSVSDVGEGPPLPGKNDGWLFAIVSWVFHSA